MILKRKYLLVILAWSITNVYGQKLKKEDKQLLANLQQHIVFLSSDKLEGRRTGSAGEKLAMEYISSEFQKIGLLPKGANAWYQPFEVAEGKQINPSTHLLINGNSLTLYKDYFPLIYSANKSLEALPSVALHEGQMPWFLDIKELMDQNKDNPHFEINDNIKTLASEMEGKGASAIFLYNTSGKEDGLVFNEKDKTAPLNIPVVYITKEVAKKYLADEAESLDIKLKTDIGPKTRTGNNVIGYIDNAAAATVVLGAHFDHLGYGEDGNSMMRNGEKQIHNGADDNASGTAALIELARLLKSSKARQNNYLFIAFSGEELGLYGSKYFVEHPTTDLAKINYMVNMDMLGRLNESSHVVTVGGFGTSPGWGETFSVSGKNKLYTGPLVLKYDSSGTGPSDHTSFYRKDIPVLFYFTGLHSDYHKPTDDFDKINYAGEMHIVKHLLSLIETTGKRSGKIAFTKTREMQTSASARFSVTMGIMPDYTFSGNGVRVDGVSENRPAQKAGLKTGDIIMGLGVHTISSMEEYMQALGKFKKGDKTNVIYSRGGEKLTVIVEF